MLKPYRIVGRIKREYKALILSLEHSKCSVNGCIEAVPAVRIQCLFNLSWKEDSGGGIFLQRFNIGFHCFSFPYLVGKLVIHLLGVDVWLNRRKNGYSWHLNVLFCALLNIVCGSI